MQFFYPFRTTDALLGERDELRKQEIYFAPPDQLNDPMEGFKDVYWQGDRIVWTNLIRHYLLSLELTMLSAFATGESYRPEEFQVPIFASDIALPTPEARDTYRKICQSFFSNSEAATIPDMLAECGHQIRREELTFYLRTLHGRAISCIIGVLHQIPPTMPDAVAKALPTANVFQALKQRDWREKDFSGRLFQLAGTTSFSAIFMQVLQPSACGR